MARKARRGFLASLFDLSFDEFITTRVVKVLYALGIVGAAVTGLTYMYTGISSGSAWAGLVALIAAPFLFLLSVISLRIWLELVMVVFRMAEDMRRLANGGQAGGSNAAQVQGDRPTPSS